MVKKLIFLLLLVPTLVFGQSRFNRGIVVGGGTALLSITVEDGAIYHNAGTRAGQARLPRGFEINGVYIDRITYVGGTATWTVGSTSSRKFQVQDGLIIGNGATIDSLNLVGGAVVGAYVDGTLFPFFFEEFIAGDYFVDDIDGDDLNAGTSPDEAWKTLTKVNSVAYVPGDTISFIKGGVWRLIDDLGGDWNMSWIGAKGNNITFDSYGTGDKPRILGSDTIGKYIDLGSNIWYGYKASLDSFPSGSIYFEELDGTVSWGILETSGIGQLDTLYEYVYSHDTVYVYSTSDPLVAYISLEIPQVENLIELQCRYDSAEYYEFNGLDLRYATNTAIRNDWPGGIDGNTRQVHGITVRNCDISFIGYKGSSGAFGLQLNYSDILVENCDISNCGRRGISFNTDGNENMDTISNNVVQDNYLHDGFHTTGIDIGNNSNDLVQDSIIIRRNLIEDDPAESIAGSLNSNSIFIKNGSTGKVNNVFIYNNLIANTKSRSINLEALDSVYVYNNTMWGVNENLTSSTYGHIYCDGTYDYLWIRNNITYTNVSGFCNVKTTNLTNTTFDYNLHFTEYPTANNFYVNSVYYKQTDWAAYKVATSWEANSPAPIDPLLKAPPDSLRLLATSFAIGAGVDIAGYTIDYENVTVSSPPNLGAFENTYIGDTINNFIASSTVNNTITTLSVGYPLQPDSIVITADEGIDPVGRFGGDRLYAGHDTVAANDTWDVTSSADTSWTVESHQMYNGIWSVPNTDTVFVDSVVNLLTGIRAYYNFDEVSGNLLDQVNSYDGTLTGAVQGTAGKIGTCYTFDGGDYVSCTTAMSISTFTFVAWVKPDVSDAVRSIIGCSANNGVHIKINGNETIGLDKQGAAGIGNSGGNVVTNEQWNFIAVTYDASGNWEIWINANKTSGTSLQTFTFATTRIGMPNEFLGEIDEVGIWNIVKTDAQISELFNSGSGKTYPFE